MAGCAICLSPFKNLFANPTTHHADTSFIKIAWSIGSRNFMTTAQCAGSLSSTDNCLAALGMVYNSR
jgi:hypothetical protein